MFGPVIIWLTCANLSSAVACMQQVIDVSMILSSCEAHREIIFQSGATKRPVTAGVKFVCDDMPSMLEISNLLSYAKSAKTPFSLHKK